MKKAETTRIEPVRFLPVGLLPVEAEADGVRLFNTKGVGMFNEG